MHELVAGAPDARRRYLDWIAFHVEPGYLEGWRRFRRALKQRNAALRSGASEAIINGWNTEFCQHAALIDAGRRQALDASMEALKKAGVDLLGSEVGFEYRAGWAEGRELRAVLEADLEKDRQQGTTLHGPHRADLKLSYDARQARKLVSRGQQKLLACAMILAATDTAQAALERPLLLLVDDPAAELDGESLSRLMSQVAALGCQVIATSLDSNSRIFPDAPTVFHVKHGELSRAG